MAWKFFLDKWARICIHLAYKSLIFVISCI